MSFIAKNPLSLPEIDNTPSTPPGTRGLFAKKDGWYEVDSSGKETKLASSGAGVSISARSATYYIGAADTPDNEGCDFVCSNEDGKRFNDIIDSIMSDMKTNKSKQGSKIIVRNGTYYQDNHIRITEKCIMDFEKEFDLESENTAPDGELCEWFVLTDNSIFNNFKLYGKTYIGGNKNIFNNCWFVRGTYVGSRANGSGSENSFRFCIFNDIVQNGNEIEHQTEETLTGKNSAFINCRFDKNLLLAGTDIIVKGCHFTSKTDGISYNGNLPTTFKGYFSGNSMCTEESAEIGLYDEITSKFATVDIVYLKEEFDQCIIDGMYKVIYQDNPCFGIISSDKTNDIRWHTIWVPHLFSMLTRTTKISTGEMSEYKNLFIASKCVQSVTIKANKWVREQVVDYSGNIIGYRYGQVVNVENATITPNSKVDLQISSEQAIIFRDKSLAFVAENEDGVVTVYCVGDIPKNDYTIQVTVTEVSVNG